MAQHGLSLVSPYQSPQSISHTEILVHPSQAQLVLQNMGPRVLVMGTAVGQMRRGASIETLVCKAVCILGCVAAASIDSPICVHLNKIFGFFLSGNGRLLFAW